MSLPQGSLTSRVRTGFLFLWGFPGGSDGKEFSWNAGDLDSIPGSGRSPLEEEMPTHSQCSCLRIPWIEEAGGLQSMGLQRVGHN